jgi:hypothetical protein
VASFALYVGMDGAMPTLVKTISGGLPTGGIYCATKAYQAIADGQPNTYAFYSIGTNGNGVVEAAPSQPQVTVGPVTFAPRALRGTSLDIQHDSPSRSFERYIDIGFDQTRQGLQNLIGQDRIEIIKHPLSGPSAGDKPISLAGATLTALDHTIEIDFGKYGIGSVSGAQSSTAWDGY